MNAKVAPNTTPKHRKYIRTVISFIWFFARNLILTWLMALNSKHDFICWIKLFMYTTKENTMPTNTYSVEAEITRKVVVEVEATSMEEAKDLVAADPDGYETKEDTREVSIGSATWYEVEAL